MTRPLTVLMLTSSYPRAVEDTTSVFLRYLAERLHDRGIEVHVLAPADVEAGPCMENGIHVRRFRYWPRSRPGLAYGSGIVPNLRRNPWLWVQVPFFAAAQAVAALSAVRRVRPHVVHAHWVIPQGVTAALLNLLSGVPFVTTVHGADAFALGGRVLSAVKVAALRRSDAWTTNTARTARAIAGTEALPPPSVIPMGVDVDLFASGRRERLREGLPSDERIVLFVGRLVDKKGVEDLLRSFAGLPAAVGAGARLWIVGGGEREAALRALAAELGIADRTTFTGPVPNDRLPDYYAAADLFVGPSVVAESGDTEGQGVVFLEAFAAGLCVLATRVGGIAEVVEDGRTGRLVEPGRPVGLSRAMAELLEDDTLRSRLGAAARERARERYDWRRIAAEFEDLYREVSA